MDVLGLKNMGTATEGRGPSCSCVRTYHGGDAGLGDGDGLLLHGLVDGHTVLRAHLVELVDAHHTAIGEHERAAFEVELARGFAADDGGG